MAFSSFIESGTLYMEWKGQINDVIILSKNGAEAQLSKIGEVKKRLMSVKGRSSTVAKEGEEAPMDLFSSLVMQQLASVDEVMGKIGESIRLHGIAQEMLASYRFDPLKSEFGNYRLDRASSKFDDSMWVDYGNGS
jgi:hypothetical protein